MLECKGGAKTSKEKYSNLEDVKRSSNNYTDMSFVFTVYGLQLIQSQVIK